MKDLYAICCEIHIVMPVKATGQQGNVGLSRSSFVRLVSLDKFDFVGPDIVATRLGVKIAWVCYCCAS